MNEYKPTPYDVVIRCESKEEQEKINDMLKKNCNECKKNDCQYRPQKEEVARFNCPFFI